MGIVVACKLPHGLSISHQGETIVLAGANDGVDAEMRHRDDRFALTELTDAQSDAFLAWTNEATYKRDKAGKAVKENGKLDEPFLAIENGSIMWFKNRDDAKKEMGALVTSIQTGVEAIDPASDKEMKAAGVETAEKG